MIKEAIILAGGLGTRLQHIIPDLPKPMAPVCGNPFLKYVIEYLSKQNLKHLILSVGYKHKVISNYFGNKFKDMKISYACEKEPLGTGGAINFALTKTTTENIAIINGDTLFCVDFKKLFEEYLQRDAYIALALKPMKNFDRYGAVKIDKQNRITGFEEKSFMKNGYINGGVSIFKKSFLKQFSFSLKFSFEKEVLEKYYKKYPFYGFSFNNYFIDIGIPEDYEKAKAEFNKK